MTPTTERPSYYRKVIHIRAEDSPNVRLYLAEKAAGKTPTFKDLVPGVINAKSYIRRRKYWDAVKQCIGLDGKFWKGSEVLLYPPAWLNASESRALELRNLQKAGAIRRDAKLNRAIGCDPGEGGANTAWSIIDPLGVLQLVSYQTPDTSDIIGETINLIKRWEVPHERVLFDAGGGGKQHAWTLRKMGYKVGTVAFGSKVALPPMRRMRSIDERKENTEERYTYVNVRAQMYGDLREAIDPTLCEILGHPIFAIPPWYPDYRRQMAPIPLMLTREGELKMLPKHKTNPASREKTLIELLGRSPDEADSLVLALHGLLHVRKRFKARMG